MLKYTKNTSPNRPFESPSLDTLELTAENPKKSLKKRARSKWYTQAIVGRLLYTNSPLHRQYQNAYFCCHELIQEGDKIKGKYCNTRICNICNRIRTAKLIKGYHDQLVNRPEMSFVTLTLPNCKAEELRAVTRQMCAVMRQITDVYRKRKNPLNGIRKLEVTYNSRTDTYHPHFHLIVDGDAHGLVNEWLKRNPGAVYQAQDVRPVDSNSLKELFKYTTKIAVKRSSKTHNQIEVYVNALDVIMCSMYRIRTIQPFGNVRKVSEEVDEDLVAEQTDVYEFVSWLWDDDDWYSEADGEALTEYTPPDIKILTR